MRRASINQVDMYSVKVEFKFILCINYLTAEFNAIQFSDKRSMVDVMVLSIVYLHTLSCHAGCMFNVIENSFLHKTVVQME